MSYPFDSLKSNFPFLTKTNHTTVWARVSDGKRNTACHTSSHIIITIIL